MIRPVALLLLAALAVALPSPVLAEAELVLHDGRTLRGAEVKLEAGFYLLTLDSGDVMAIPSLLVRELHLLDVRASEEGATIGPAGDVAGVSPPPDAPGNALGALSGLRRGKPQDLAGGSWRLHETGEQTAAIGRPSHFQESPVAFRFKPAHAWDRRTDVLENSRSDWQRTAFDAVWRPTPAFESGVDVLASSRSRWPTAPRAQSWNPSNSFSRLEADLWWGRDPLPAADDAADEPNAVLDWSELTDACGWCRGVSTQPARFTEPGRTPLDARECALRLFADVPDVSTLEWTEAEAPLWSDLPAGLYHARTEAGVRALFSIADDSCRLIAGDLQPLLGIELSPEHALEYAVSAWNHGRLGRAVTLPATPGSRVDWALTLAWLLDPAISGRARARVELLDHRDALTRLLDDDDSCGASAAFRRAQRANVARTFEAPAVVDRGDEVRVTFRAWSSLLGEVHVYDVRLRADGTVRLSRETIAQHLGVHADPP